MATLTYTANGAINAETELDADLLNNLVRGTVTLEPGSIVAADIDRASVGAVLADQLSAANVTPQGWFLPSGWKHPAGLTVLAGQKLENAQGWWLAPVGVATTVERNTLVPDGTVPCSALIRGAPGLVRVDLSTWLMPDVTGQLSSALTVSAWIWNGVGVAITPALTVAPATAYGDQATVAVTAAILALEPVEHGQWKRVSWTINPANYPNWKNGVELGFRFGGDLDAAAKFVLVAGVQTQAGTVATAPIRQIPPQPLPRRTFPVGMLIPSADAALPEGWLWADGAEYLMTDYPELAAWAGTRFGVASVGKFKLPDLRRSVLADLTLGFCLTVAGSDEVTLPYVDAWREVLVGMRVTGVGLPAGATVLAYTGTAAAPKVKLSAAASASSGADGVILTFSPPAEVRDVLMWRQEAAWRTAYAGASWTAGATTITLPHTLGLTPGMIISGDSAIPGNTWIKAVTATTITITATLPTASPVGGVLLTAMRRGEAVAMGAGLFKFVVKT